MQARIRIVLVDDHLSYVEGLTALFEGDDRIHFVGSAHSAEEVFPLVESLKPDIVLMDYSFGEDRPDGVEVSGKLLESFPDLKIVLLTSYDDLPIVESALGNGLAGYLLKSRSRSDLKTALEAVASGFEVVEQGVLMGLFERGLSLGTRSGAAASIEHPLTPRELEIALLIAEGLSSQQIAQRLFRSTNTVDTHRKNIFAKLDVHNVAELINWLRAHELI